MHSIVNPLLDLYSWPWINEASEALRHITLLENGQGIAQETRGFDEKSGSTFKLRSKEDSPDYRYMPDPNLPPLILDEVPTLLRSHATYKLRWYYRDSFSMLDQPCPNYRM